MSTSSTMIQDARDVLAKWREQATADKPWVFEEGHPAGYYGGWVYADASGSATIADDLFPDANAGLIVGTAGNPELLDAIDGLLALYEPYQQPGAEVRPPVMAYAERIAAAIIAADERMSA